MHNWFGDKGHLIVMTPETRDGGERHKEEIDARSIASQRAIDVLKGESDKFPFGERPPVARPTAVETPSQLNISCALGVHLNGKQLRFVNS